MKESALLILGVTLILIGSAGAIAIVSSYYSTKLYMNELSINMGEVLSIAKDSVDDGGTAITEMIAYFKIMAEYANLSSILFPQLGNTSASISPLISSLENLHADIHLSSERIDSMTYLAQDIFQKTARIVDISFSVLAILLVLFAIIGISILFIRRGIIRSTSATEERTEISAANGKNELE